MILFYALALSIVYLVTESWIFRTPRLLVGARASLAARVLIYCPACFGFWTGLAMGYWCPLDLPLWRRLPAAAFTTMLAGAVWSRWFARSPYATEKSLIDELIELDTQEIPHDPSQATETTETEGH